MELKPCLFCQSADVHYLKEEHHPLYHFDGLVVCDSCEIEVKCTPEQWNTRAIDPLLKEMAEALDGLLYRTDGITFQEKWDVGARVLQKYHEQEGE